MDYLFNYLDITKRKPKKLSGAFVMISGNVYNLTAFACLTQEFLYYVIVGLRPIERLLKSPAINNVAYQLEFLCFIVY